MTLVVVHGDDGVKVTGSGAQEDRIGRDGAGDVQALGAQTSDGGLDELLLLGAEQAVLAGVRVEPGDGQVWLSTAVKPRRYRTPRPLSALR